MKRMYTIVKFNWVPFMTITDAS